MESGDQHFCLRWNNHQNTLISVFHNLLNSSTLVDCALSAEGKTIQAHKVLLSACSPYFATLLSQHFDKHPIIILKDVKYTELKSMMEYMYRGEVNISQDQLGAFLKAAESLQIKGLTDNSGVNKKISDVASMSESSMNEEESPQPPQAPACVLQPRKIDELLSNPNKKCKKYTSPPNMFPTPSRSPLQNANAITPPMYPGLPFNPALFIKKENDKVHGGKRRKLNTPVKNFENVVSPGELLETKIEEGPPGSLRDPLYGNAPLTPSMCAQAELGEDLSNKKVELFNNNHHIKNHSGPPAPPAVGNAFGNDREPSSELGSVNNSSAHDNDLAVKSDEGASGGSVGDPSDEPVVTGPNGGGEPPSAAALASAEEVAKRKLNELNMEKFTEFQEKMRQILKMNNVNFPGLNMSGGEGSPGGMEASVPLDFSKFDPASPAATAFAFAKLNSAGFPQSGGEGKLFSPSGEGKFDTSAAAVAAFNAASALARASMGGKYPGGGKTLDSSQEDMEDEMEYNEEEGGEDGGDGSERRCGGGGSVANSVHSDDGLERYRDFLANTDLSSLQDNPAALSTLARFHWLNWDPNPKYVRTTQENQYSCQHCGKRYRWKSTLKRHEVFECGGKEPVHQCPHCDYRAKQSGNLRVHIRKYHTSIELQSPSPAPRKPIVNPMQTQQQASNLSTNQTPVAAAER
ncbi:longitudinals lacking protein-like [Diaphorina citri]|uniref:Longitudinals lacking protein-like n=1 Tax=Diaphorina citri TaxID=121845 RepID=A0A1S3DCT8_DIACI|nr:longitudinals lacking protein-like [Diaphorina citri]